MYVKQQNFGGDKNFGAALPPNAPRGYGPGRSYVIIPPDLGSTVMVGWSFQFAFSRLRYKLYVLGL